MLQVTIRPNLNQTGLSLLEVVVAIGLLGIAATAFVDISSLSLRVQTQSNVTASADLIRKTFVGYLTNNITWQNTVNAAANDATLACLRPGAPTPCVNGAGGGFQLFDMAANPVMPSGFVAPGSYGFSLSGAPCTNFSKTGSDSCPFRLNLNWKAICAGAGCITPQVQVTGTLTYTPATQSKTVSFNSDNYSFTLVRVAQTTLLCYQRKATTAQKSLCGFNSTAQCNPGETPVAGGLWGGSGGFLQNSTPDPQTDGSVPTGWFITVYDAQQGPAGTWQACTSSDPVNYQASYTPNGTVAAGNPPCFPTNGGQMCGAAVVMCCMAQ